MNVLPHDALAQQHVQSVHWHLSARFPGWHSHAVKNNKNIINTYQSINQSIVRCLTWLK